MDINKALDKQAKQVKAVKNINSQLTHMIKDTQQTLSNDKYALHMIQKSRTNQKLASKIGKIATKVESDVVKND